MRGRDVVRLCETLQRSVEVDHVHRTAHRGRLSFAHVEMRFDPAPWNVGVRLQTEIPLARGTGPLLAGVEHGLDAVAQLGLFAGRPVIGVTATLLRASPQDLEAPFIPFAIAAAIAFRHAAVDGRAAVVEPIMRVEVVAPNDRAKEIVRALKIRRGSIVSIDPQADGRSTWIEALAPHAEVFDIFPVVRVATQGRCQARMTLHGYAPTPDQPEPGTWAPTDGGPDLFPPAIGMRA
jgi:elongation factor G